MSLTRPQRQNYETNQAYADVTNLYRLVEDLMRQVSELQAKLGIAQQGSTRNIGGIARAINIPAASDPNAQAQVYGAGVIPEVPSLGSISISGGSTGYTFTGTSPNFTMTLSSGSTVRSAISAAAKASPAITGATIPLAKITGPGADGSITVNTEGIVTAYVAPT